MKQSEVIQFIIDNNNERLLDYYSKCYDKLKEMNRRSERLTLYMIFIVLIYFVIRKSPISSVIIGPIAISDLTVIKCLMPVLFAYSFFEYIVLSNHKANLFTTVKLLFTAIYKQPVDKESFDNTKNNLVTRMILPFAVTLELSKFRFQKFSIFNSTIGLILIIPFLSLIILPFYFEFFMLREVYNNYFHELFGKLCFILSIYIMCIVLYHIFNNAIVDHESSKTNQSLPLT